MGIQALASDLRGGPLMVLHPEAFPSKGKEKGTRGLGSTGVDLTCLTLDMTDRPIITLKVQGRKILGLLDTGANKSIISQQEWPPRWPLTQAKQTLRGLGITQSPDQSAATLEWEDDEGHRGTFQPYVCNIPISLWGRDVLEQMSVRLTTETIYSPRSIAMMQKMGYIPGKGLGKQEQGKIDTIPFTSEYKGQGLGFR
ncbi:endogenous retrovirus group K member 21 Pro protein-like [Mustela putorius furo]|uniref:human endogenous retrovirus K endopeptidase n=1 Tax=Mustela putorius furo TaxID=9669 RepID=A0A8U0URB1_MUSPF|nr:endogenous retrovirus group K member 21 Pro protein-like [Mustela putorius furo]